MQNENQMQQNMSLSSFLRNDRLKWTMTGFIWQDLSKCRTTRKSSATFDTKISKVWRNYISPTCFFFDSSYFCALQLNPKCCIGPGRITFQSIFSFLFTFLLTISNVPILEQLSQSTNLEPRPSNLQTRILLLKTGWTKGIAEKC